MCLLLTAPVTEPTTEPTVPDATNPPLIVSDPYSSSILIPSPTGTVPAPTGTVPTPTTTPLPTDPTNSSGEFFND